MPSPPPPSAPTTAGGKPTRSAIVGGTTVSGHHLLDIEGYSHVKKLPTGKSIVSRSFSLGGSSWRILYYPNGDSSDNAEFISLYLRLDQSVGKTVKAQAKFSLLDQAGKPVRSQTTNLHELSVANSYGYARFINRTWLEESTCLKDDAFTIRCDIVISMELMIRTEERMFASPPSRAASPWVVVPPSDLQHQLGDLLEAKESSADVAFQVAGETFKAHMCVLAARSPVLKAKLFGAMEECNSMASMLIRVDGMEAKVFGALLGFIYTDMLPDVPDMTLDVEVAMTQHLLVAAKKYDLERLRLICEHNLCKLIDTGSAATILAFAVQHNCQGLKKACFQFLSCPSTLNDVVATDGFEHLGRSCPSVVKELISNVLARVNFDRRKAAQTKYWYQVLVLVVLCIVLSLKGGNVPLSCFCFIIASFVVATMK